MQYYGRKESMLEIYMKLATYWFSAASKEGLILTKSGVDIAIGRLNDSCKVL